MDGDKNLHQNIAMWNRQRAQFIGIEKVESFTKPEIAALFVLENITVWDSGMKIHHFSTEMKIFIVNPLKTMAESCFGGLIFGIGYDIIRAVYILCRIATYRDMCEKPIPCISVCTAFG